MTGSSTAHCLFEGLSRVLARLKSQDKGLSQKALSFSSCTERARPAARQRGATKTCRQTAQSSGSIPRAAELGVGQAPIPCPCWAERLSSLATDPIRPRSGVQRHIHLGSRGCPLLSQQYSCRRWRRCPRHRPPVPRATRRLWPTPAGAWKRCFPPTTTPRRSSPGRLACRPPSPPARQCGGSAAAP